MVKFQTFLKRTGALMSVMVLLVSLSLPAFAAVEGEHYLSVPFDSFAFVYGESSSSYYWVPWIGNVFGSEYPKAGTKIQSGRYANDWYSLFSVNSVSDQLHLIFDSGMDYNSGGLAFASDSMVLLESDLRQGAAFEFVFGENGNLSGICNVRVTANKVALVGDEYVIQSRTFMDRYSFDSLGFDLYPALDQLIPYDYRSDGYIYLTDVLLTFNVIGSAEDGGYFEIFSPDRGDLPSVDDWFSQYDLPFKKEVIVNPADPSGVNFVDWLTVAVGGFLDFELWPGMSLNEIMWIILVAGVLFWFLKLTI